MGEFAAAVAPIRELNQPIMQVPGRGIIGRWMMILCAEILNALTKLEQVGRDPLLTTY